MVQRFGRLASLLALSVNLCEGMRLNHRSGQLTLMHEATVPHKEPLAQGLHDLVDGYPSRPQESIDEDKDDVILDDRSFVAGGGDAMRSHEEWGEEGMEYDGADEQEHVGRAVNNSSLMQQSEGEVLQVGGFEQHLQDTARPISTKLQRSGSYSWSLVKNCKAVKANIERKQINIKPRGVSWSQLQRWNTRWNRTHTPVWNASRREPINTWYDGLGRVPVENITRRDDTGYPRSGLMWCNDFWGKIQLSIRIKYMFGGRVKGKGRFLKHLRLVPRPWCRKGFDMKVKVTDVKSYVSKRFSTKADPVAVAQIGIEVEEMEKKRPSTKTTNRLKLWVLGNGLILQNRVGIC